MPLALTLAALFTLQVAAGKIERRGARGTDSPETPDRPELRSAAAAAARAPAVQENGDAGPEAAGSSGATPVSQSLVLRVATILG